jgi:hypothetical protein
VALLGTHGPAEAEATASPAGSVTDGADSEGHREAAALRAAAASLHSETSKGLRRATPPASLGRAFGVSEVDGGPARTDAEEESGFTGDEQEDSGWGLDDLSGADIPLGDEDDEAMDVSSFDMDQD